MNDYLNQDCLFVFDLESMLFREGCKIPFSTVSAHSGHASVHCTCPLLGVKRTYRFALHKGNRYRVVFGALGITFLYVSGPNRDSDFFAFDPVLGAARPRGAIPRCPRPRARVERR